MTDHNDDKRPRDGVPLSSIPTRVCDRRLKPEHLTGELAERLAELAKETGVPLEQIIKKALRDKNNS